MMDAITVFTVKTPDDEMQFAPVVGNHNARPIAALGKRAAAYGADVRVFCFYEKENRLSLQDGKTV